MLLDSATLPLAPLPLNIFNVQFLTSEPTVLYHAATNGCIHSAILPIHASLRAVRGSCSCCCMRTREAVPNTAGPTASLVDIKFHWQQCSVQLNPLAIDGWLQSAVFNDLDIWCHCGFHHSDNDPACRICNSCVICICSSSYVAQSLASIVLSARAHIASQFEIQYCDDM